MRRSRDTLQIPVSLQILFELLNCPQGKYDEVEFRDYLVLYRNSFCIYFKTIKPAD